MATTKGSIVGREVYDKKAGLMGKVVREDGLSLVIQFPAPDEGGEPVVKTITPNTFKRWYKLVDEDPAPDKGTEESAEPAADTEQPQQEGGDEPAPEAAAKITRRHQTSVPDDQKGAKGVGQTLTNMFLELIKAKANQDLEVSKTKDPRMTVIKYNGKNVFEITTALRRMVVLCHGKSLTPENKKQATKIYPDSFGWPLNTKFVFTEEAQKPLMVSIITDGLFYRQIVEREADKSAEQEG